MVCNTLHVLLLRDLQYLMGNPLFQATSLSSQKEAVGESKYPDK